jgi:hypothetical protein
MYVFGPVTLYWLALRLGAHRGAAFAAALFYSLVSPSTLLMPQMARDMGGWWFAQRFHVLTGYGEGPHVSAMTLIPIVVLALQNALERRSRRAFALAALPIALVFLMNVPGTMALGLSVFAWICSQPKDRLARAWMLAGGAAAFAYALACYGIPPMSLRTVFGNTGGMHPGFANSLKHGPWALFATLLACAALGYVLSRTPLPLLPRFALLHFGLIATLVLTSDFHNWEMLPQVGRLHLEMEMGICLLAGLLLWMLYAALPPWVRPVLLVICLAPALVQWRHYRQFAHGATPRVELEKHSEYTSARWLDEHMRDRRVYTMGSTGFWLNAFTDTPQMKGCCDQGQSMQVLTAASYLINSSISPLHTRMAIAYLHALGVEAIVVNGPSSTDEYKDIKDPERFRGLLPVLHEENGDTIYAVGPHGDTPALAKILRPDEPLPQRPEVIHEEVLQFVDKILAPGRPQATFEWIRNGHARIRANLRGDDLLLVQVAYLPGWKATVNGQSRPVTKEGLGLTLVAPQCEGNCEVSLDWGGRPDSASSLAISLYALAAFFALCFSKRVA